MSKSEFYFYFLNVFSYQGERIKKFFEYQQAKNKIRSAKMDPKIGTFGHIDTCDLAILGVKKIVFGALFFPTLFKTCLGSV